MGCILLKGTIIIRGKEVNTVKYQADGTLVNHQVVVPVMLHEDLIADKFWEGNPHVLA
jgi:hypothetical protein